MAGGETAASLTLVNSDYPLRQPGESPGQTAAVLSIYSVSVLVAANIRESKTPEHVERE